MGDKWSMISEAEAVHDTYVVGPLKWKTFNPGAQRIGSFRPMSEDFWDTDCYLDPEEQTRG